MAVLNFNPLSEDSINEFRKMIDYRLIERKEVNDTVSVGNFLEHCRNEIEDATFVSAFITWWEGGQIGERPTVSISMPTQEIKDKMNEVIKMEIQEMADFYGYIPEVTIEDILEWAEVNFHIIKDDVYIQDKLDEMA